MLIYDNIQYHSIETGLVRIHDDLLRSVDNKNNEKNMKLVQKLQSPPICLSLFLSHGNLGLFGQTPETFNTIK